VAADAPQRKRTFGEGLRGSAAGGCGDCGSGAL